MAQMKRSKESWHNRDRIYFERQDQEVHGSQPPGEHALTTMLSLYQGVGITAKELSPRLNSSVGQVLEVLLRLEQEGRVSRIEPADDTLAKWTLMRRS